MAAVSLSEPLEFKDKKEAEKILREEAVHKDFWAVNDYQDNCERLQALINALFNTVEGNNYVVDYQENQNGTRLVVVCKVCCKELTSYDPFIAHENGKPHKKVRNKSLCVNEPNLETLELQPHNKPRGTFPEGSLEDQIDCTNYRVLGLQFVYKEVIDDKETFTCQLCQGSADVRHLPASRMFSHLISKGHNQKYLEVKFGYLKTTSKEFEEECRAIEEFEGKIHTNIVDLTIESPYSKSKEDRHSQPPRSPTPPRKERKHKTEPVPVEPKEEVKPIHRGPEMCDAAVGADLTSGARFILHEINALQDIDCLMTLQEDDDMQDLLKETLWELAGKMEKYYSRTQETYNEGEKKIPLAGSADKVKQYVAELAELK